MIRIGIIGCGTIGSAIAQAVQKKFSRFARLACISDINPDQIKKIRQKLKQARLKAQTLSKLIQQVDLVIETASVGAAEEAIPQALKNGKDILVLSVGGVLRIKNLTALLARSKGRVYIPSGAVAGIDSVLAAKTGRIQSVRITTRKPLKSLKSAPYFLNHGFDPRRIQKSTLIFKGNVLKAIRYFPENINVAATLSLAGIGPQKTQVQIFTSPTFRYNQHEIEVKGRFGRMVSQVTNFPSQNNPKTSVLAIGSAIAALEKIFSRFRVGT
ncbi:MAG: DUF108 domain-containing protein [Candidatus Omnitrophica bacterium]|nr:DUF108 domain-containing protein [Candidatus Omnitrophota bacterium]